MLCCTVLCCAVLRCFVVWFGVGLYEVVRGWGCYGTVRHPNACVQVRHVAGVAAGLLAAATLGVHAALPALQREALVELYNSTDGPGWEVSTNWLTGDPCSTNWALLACDATNSSVRYSFVCAHPSCGRVWAGGRGTAGVHSRDWDCLTFFVLWSQSPVPDREQTGRLPAQLLVSAVGINVCAALGLVACVCVFAHAHQSTAVALVL